MKFRIVFLLPAIGMALYSSGADACTWPTQNEFLSGDGHYRAKLNCRQDLRDFFWNSYDFDESDWDEGWGLGGPCDSTYPLARTFHGLFALHFSHPNPITSGSNYGNDPLRWGGQFSRNNIDELDGKCTNGNAAALTAMWPLPDQYTNLYRSFFYDMAPSERAGTIVHEALHAALGWPAGDHDADNCRRGGSCDDFFGEQNANTLEVNFLASYALRAINANYINKDRARDRANEILDTGFNTPTNERVFSFPDVPLYADMNGDAIGDPTIFRSASGQWFSLNGKKLLSGVREEILSGLTLGMPTDQPLVGDVDGDLRNDIIVFRTHSHVNLDARVPGTWFAYSPHKGQVLFWAHVFGGMHDVPLVGDLNADGADDIIVYNSNGAWNALSGRHLSTGVVQPVITNAMWGGVGGDVPLVGRFDFDGADDICIFRASEGTWWGWSTYRGVPLFSNVVWGVNTDVPLVGDFDNDTRDDLVIYRPRHAQWWARSLNGPIFGPEVFGGLTDRPFTGRNGVDPSARSGFTIFQQSTGNWSMVDRVTKLGIGGIPYGFPY